MALMFIHFLLAFKYNIVFRKDKIYIDLASGEQMLSYDNIKGRVVDDKATRVKCELVSIIMPVYNTPSNLLTAAVKSVMLQTYEKIELIIVDDGSEKSCADVCDRLAAEDNRIRVFHNENSGVSVVRNIGLNKSKGEYIAFLDSDDTMMLNTLQVMVEHIKGVDFVTCGCNHVKQTVMGGKANLYNMVTIRSEKCIDYLCYMYSPYSHIETNAIWGKLYRKKLLKDLRYDESMVMGEDFKFNFDYITKCSEGKYLDFCGYNYLERGGSLSRKYNNKMIQSIDVLEKMIQEYANTSVLDALVSRSVNIAFSILMMVPDECKDERDKIVEFISKYRDRVVSNPLTKNKVKLAVLTSYIGYRFTKMLFRLSR